ncbi:MAG: hypothetical protein PHO92_04610 [Candidatus Peribacteraceae bacterium]|nr:hypothetical protein [Candidatus Peribacteraceae bacterium]
MSTDSQTAESDVFARAQWLLDHPEEAQKMLGESLERSAREAIHARGAALHEQYEALCRTAVESGSVPAAQVAQHPTRLEIIGTDERTGQQTRFVVTRGKAAC